MNQQLTNIESKQMKQTKINYTNNKDYKIITQVIPFKNGVVKFKQVFKLINNCWVFVKELENETTYTK